MTSKKLSDASDSITDLTAHEIDEVSGGTVAEFAAGVAVGVVLTLLLL